MAHPSPLQSQYEQDRLPTIPYGDATQLVAYHGSVEIEYAAMRKAVALIDHPQRGLIHAGGAARGEFLQRMLTNQCDPLPAGEPRRAFLLSHKGRIQADLTLIDDGEATWIDLDIHQAGEVCDELNKMVFGEDVQFENRTDQLHRLSLHGPLSSEAAQTIADQATMHYEMDQTGSNGVHVWLPVDKVEKAWESLITQAEQWRLKPAGWLAFNIARIEAAQPLFHVDFGPNSLPHETSLLAQTVNFTKGCYRGQEVVARMESLGHPAKLLVAFTATGEDIPIESTSLYPSGAADAVGAVTSSTFSPRRSGAPIGFAMVKWGHHEPETKLDAALEKGRVELTVCSLDQLASV
jgi:folate-binding protein YgfZ